MHLLSNLPLAKSVALLCFLLCPAVSLGQAKPTATVDGHLQVGAAYSWTHPDYGTRNGNGFYIFGDADIWKHFGVEAEGRHTSSSDRVSETSYGAGARFRYPIWRVEPYLRIVAGGGSFSFQNSSQNGTYGMYAGGGGLDVRIVPRIVFRVDYEYQRWGGFIPNGLQPNLASVGAAYRFR